MYRWAYDYSVPGAKYDFIPQNVSPDEWLPQISADEERPRFNRNDPHANFPRAADAAVVWWIVRQTINVKPWAADAGTEALQDYGVPMPGTRTGLPSVKLGLAVLLAVATSLFALFVSAYSIRMELTDWRPVPDPGLLWFNTGLLVLASIGLQWAWQPHAPKKKNLVDVRRGLLAGGVFTVAFLVGQLWRLAAAASSSPGYYDQSNPANAFFYLLTAVHGLHICWAAVWCGATQRLRRVMDPLGGSRCEPGSSGSCSVELCTIYWHFLLLVWLCVVWLAAVYLRHEVQRITDKRQRRMSEEAVT